MARPVQMLARRTQGLNTKLQQPVALYWGEELQALHAKKNSGVWSWKGKVLGINWLER